MASSSESYVFQHDGYPSPQSHLNPSRGEVTVKCASHLASFIRPNIPDIVQSLIESPSTSASDPPSTTSGS